MMHMMTDLATPPLQWKLSLRVLIGQEMTLGRSREGNRANYPILGGDFTGDAIEGEILASGADFFCQHADGTATLDARYSLKTSDGVLINILNEGKMTFTENGRKLVEECGIWPIPESAFRCECSPRFQAPAGRYHWLSERIFIGTVRYPEADIVQIDCYVLD